MPLTISTRLSSNSLLDYTSLYTQKSSPQLPSPQLPYKQIDYSLYSSRNSNNPQNRFLIRSSFPIAALEGLDATLLAACNAAKEAKEFNGESIDWGIENVATKAFLEEKLDSDFLESVVEDNLYSENNNKSEGLQKSND